jgi:hypothetical protein
MKQVFVSLVMICSLLLAICGCSNDFTLQLEPNLEVPEKPGIIQKKPGENKPNPSYEEEPEEPEDLDLEDIDQEDEDDSDIDYPDTDQEETENYEPEITEIVPLEFVDFNLLSKKEISFNFTTAVNNVFCAFTPHQEIERIQGGKTVNIYLKENLELQTEFLIDLNVKDDWDNSLSVEVPLFVNDWIPKMVINELRTEYSSSASRAEYIEFKVISAGNLDGFKLNIMWDSKKPYIFDLPPIDVKPGEYVVFHLRTLESTCVNELGEDLTESEGTDSSPNARDLWVSGSTKLLHKTDIVYLQYANGRILDAIVLNEEPGETWKKNQSHFTEIIEKLYNSGAWKSADGHLPGPLDAVDTSTIKTSATKSISRYEGKENTHTAKDWYVTDKGGASPGRMNK